MGGTGREDEYVYQTWLPGPDAQPGPTYSTHALDHKYGERTRECLTVKFKHNYRAKA